MNWVIEETGLFSLCTVRSESRASPGQRRWGARIFLEAVIRLHALLGTNYYDSENLEFRPYRFTCRAILFSSHFQCWLFPNFYQRALTSDRKQQPPNPGAFSPHSLSLCTCVYIYINVCICMLICICLWVFMCTYICMKIFICIHTHTHINTHRHTYTKEQLGL